MDNVNLLVIALVAACAVCYAISLYHKVNGNIFAAASELIAMAEATWLTGETKMSHVVDALYSKVPAPLKKIFTPEYIQEVVQCIFDQMREYAEQYNDNDGEIASTETIKAEMASTAADLISELVRLTVPELKKKAEEYGISLDGVTKKDDILRAIIEAVLKKA